MGQEHSRVELGGSSTIRAPVQVQTPGCPPWGWRTYPPPWWSAPIPGTWAQTPFIIPILQLRKLRLREIEELTRKAAAELGLGPRPPDPRPRPLAPSRSFPEGNSGDFLKETVVISYLLCFCG